MRCGFPFFVKFPVRGAKKRAEGPQAKLNMCPSDRKSADNIHVDFKIVCGFFLLLFFAILHAQHRRTALKLVSHTEQYPPYTMVLICSVSEVKIEIHFLRSVLLCLGILFANVMQILGPFSTHRCGIKPCSREKICTCSVGNLKLQHCWIVVVQKAVTRIWKVLLMAWNIQRCRRKAKLKKKNHEKKKVWGEQKFWRKAKKKKKCSKKIKVTQNCRSCPEILFPDRQMCGHAEWHVSPLAVVRHDQKQKRIPVCWHISTHIFCFCWSKSRFFFFTLFQRLCWIQCPRRLAMMSWLEI